MSKKSVQATSTSLIFFAAFSAGLNAQSLDDILFESSEHLRTGEVVPALELLSKHENTYGEEQEFLNNLAIAYLGNNQPEKALSIMRDIVESDPLFSIVSHNYLELELGAAGAKTDRVSPILFVQTVDSFAKGIPVPESSSAGSLANNTPAPEGNPVNPPAKAPESINEQTTASELSPNELVAQKTRQFFEDSLKSVVLSWAESWSEKDFERYVLHYASGFKPESGISVRAWEAQRRERLAKPGEIRVTISNIQIMGDFASPKVWFEQTYESVGYSDKTLKEMSFEQNNNRWKINSERTIEQR